MKRTLLFCLAAIIALSLVSACSRPVPEPSIEITTPATITVDTGNSATISFTSNNDWTVVPSETWCKVSPASGPAGKTATVTVTLDPNPTYEPRTTTVTVKAGGIEKTVTVKQEAGVGLIIDGATFEVPKTGGQLTVPVQANVDYTVTPDANWITVVSTKALQDYTITLECAGNDTGEDRSSKVTVSGGGVSQTFTVNQAACEYITIVNVWSQKDDMMLAATDLITIVRGWGGAGYRQAGFTAFFTTELTDCDFALLCSEDAEGWVNQTYDTYYDENNQRWCFYFELASNSDYEPRTGHIRIVDKNSGHVSNQLTVYQIALPEHAIDMGTSVYWHEFNLGATSPGEYGDYYAWGELEPKTTYTWDNYYWAGENKYTIVEHYSGGGYSYKGSLDYEDDAATQKLGYKGLTEIETEASWHIPYQWDFKELLETREHPDTYKWEWTTVGGHAGWHITYLVNGNTLFLPAAGSIYGGSEVSGAGTKGAYWAADHGMPDNPNQAYSLNFDSGVTVVNQDGQKAAGYSIRPVTY